MRFGLERGDGDGGRALSEEATRAHGASDGESVCAGILSEAMRHRDGFGAVP